MLSGKRREMSSFGWLNVTQFFGALNDNVFKMLVVFFLVDSLNSDRDATQSIASLVFVVPFLLFSHAAGVLADRHSKRHIIVAAKVSELLVMVFGLVALSIGNALLLYALLFIMCVQSAFFGPSKYGVIPELVEDHRLSQANSFLVSLSYLAIIIGTFIPSFFLNVLFVNNYMALALFCVVVSMVGLFASSQIEVTPAVGVRGRFTPWFIADIFKTLFGLRKDRYLQLALLGSAYFLFLAVFIQLSLLSYGNDVLMLSLTKSGYLFPVAAVGIGVGALLGGRLSGRNIELGIVPFGAIGLSICCFLFNVIPERIPAVLSVVFLLGLSSGLFIVPLNAFIQYRAPRERRGEILACCNFMSFLGAALSAGLFYILSTVFNVTPGHCFVVVAILTAILALITLVLLPDFFIRFCTLLITRTFYRIKIGGLDNIPVSGGALLVSNHVTWVDALLISATQQRRVRFIMARDIYETWWINPLFKLMGVLPISANDPPRQVVASLKAAREAIDDGYLVCIFAEGALTRNGNMHGFRPGFDRIVKGSSAPIIPVHIGGAWGSIFSYYHGKLLSVLPRRIPYSVSVLFGEPLASSTPPEAVRTAVCELSCDAVEMRKKRNRTLNELVVHKARRNWFRKSMGDTTGKQLSFGKVLISAIALGDLLRKETDEDDMIGIVMPASVAGALLNVAITLMGKVPVNLNFTASSSSIASAMDQCNIKTVVTARQFVEKLKGFEAPEGSLFLEDLMPKIGAFERCTALLKALVLSPKALAGGRRIAPDDLASIIFSSGSTAEPKGVMLSHHNLISNVESTQLVFKFKAEDRFCAALPFFHSFGLTVTLWAPLVCGFEAQYHANPLDGAIIGAMVRERKLTVMVATPTFLLSYIRRTGKSDFSTLRAVVTGAEKLKPRISEAFESKFGIRPVEGYGTTELSPVGAINVPDVNIGGFRQVGSKEGSVGHPVPAVAARIVDPDSLDVLYGGVQGLLQVKGPNVMLGYLGKPELTAEVLQEGWYSTGDIARIDEDGFIFLLDRLSRYSKIGGEMVPHMAIEDALMDGIGLAEPCVAVTAAPDERKGEQIVVCYTDAAGDVATLHNIIKLSEIPNLWKPKKDNFVRIEAIPSLGTGKLDLKGIKEIAREFVETRPSAVQRTMTRIREAL